MRSAGGKWRIIVIASREAARQSTGVNWIASQRSQ